MEDSKSGQGNKGINEIIEDNNLKILKESEVSKKVEGRNIFQGLINFEEARRSSIVVAKCWKNTFYDLLNEDSRERQ